MKVKALLFLAAILFASSIHAQDLTIKVDKKGRVGFVDQQGSEVVKCQYESVTPFENGISIVSKSKKFGMVNTVGKLILPLKYTSITKWNDHLYVASTGKVMGLVNNAGNIVLPMKYSMISKCNSYGKAVVGVGGKPTQNDNKTYMNGAKYGIINADGRILVNPQYKGLYEFSFDGTNVNPYHEGKRLAFNYHYITDTLVTDCKYLGFSKNGANIYNCGILDERGMVLMKESKYDFIMEPSNDMVRYYITSSKKTKCGYHNLNTNKSMEVYTYDKGMNQMNFWSHGDFVGDIAPVTGDTWKFIDKNGNTLRTGYEKLRHTLHLGLWAAMKNNKWEVFDENNNNITALSGYEDVLFPKGKNDTELFVVEKDSKYGLIDKSGNVKIPMKYEDAWGVSYDMITIKNNGKWGIVSIDDQEIVPTEYINLLVATEKNQQHFWVQKSDSLYYHYNMNTHKLATTGYKVANNFENGLAFVVPKLMLLLDTEVNRAQVYYPGASQAEIAKVNIAENKGVFGILVNTDDEVVLNKPVSTAYEEKAKERISSLGNRPLTGTESRRLLLELTNENRSYNMKKVLDEDEWDY